MSNKVTDAIGTLIVYALGFIALDVVVILNLVILRMLGLL